MQSLQQKVVLESVLLELRSVKSRSIQGGTVCKLGKCFVHALWYKVLLGGTLLWNVQ